jgi:hypothetical protein
LHIFVKDIDESGRGFRSTERCEPAAAGGQPVKRKQSLRQLEQLPTGEETPGNTVGHQTQHSKSGIQYEECHCHFRVEEVKLLTARQVMRPQVKFKHLIDNSDAPFVPRLTDKPHALKPLSILVEYDDKGHREIFL